MWELDCKEGWAPKNKCFQQGQGVGEEEGEMNGESSMEAYTLPYVKQIAKGSFLYDSENSNCDSVTT